MQHKKQKLIYDVLYAIEEIESFIDHKSLMDFVGDRFLQAAIERKIEIIGEALRRLCSIDQTVAENISDVERIIGMRNIIAHGYDVVEPEIIWTAIEKHIPILKEEISKIR